MAEIPGQTENDMVIVNQPEVRQDQSVGIWSGLEELAKTDKLVVEQKAKLSEVCCGYERKHMTKWQFGKELQFLSQRRTPSRSATASELYCFVRWSTATAA